MSVYKRIHQPLQDLCKLQNLPLYYRPALGRFVVGLTTITPSAKIEPIITYLKHEGVSWELQQYQLHIILD